MACLPSRRLRDQPAFHRFDREQETISFRNSTLFLRPIMILPDQVYSLAETRLRTIARTAAGRHIFLVFTIRDKQGKRHIRPISARYMHIKEVQHYEKENPHF
jgi:uncharacterized DUF497 family protein